VGAGAEMRQSLGTAVFAGMLGVTFFGLLFTPMFYVLVRWLSSFLRRGTANKHFSKRSQSSESKMDASNNRVAISDHAV